MAGEVTYTLSEAVYVAAQKEWWWNRLFRRRMLWLLMSMVIGLVWGWLIDPPGPGQVVLWALGSASGGVLVMAVLTMLQRFLWLPYHARKLYRQTAIYDGKPITVAWSDEGVILTTTRGTNRFGWSDFRSWHDGRSAVLLYYNDRQASILPRAAFDASELIDLCDTIARSVRRNG